MKNSWVFGIQNYTSLPNKQLEQKFIELIFTKKLFGILGFHKFFIILLFSYKLFNQHSSHPSKNCLKDTFSIFYCFDLHIPIRFCPWVILPNPKYFPFISLTSWHDFYVTTCPILRQKLSNFASTHELVFANEVWIKNKKFPTPLYGWKMNIKMKNLQNLPKKKFKEKKSSLD